MLPIKAASTASQWIRLSAAHAKAVPTMTGVTESVSVRGRAAMIQEPKSKDAFNFPIGRDDCELRTTLLLWTKGMPTNHVAAPKSYEFISDSGSKIEAASQNIPQLAVWVEVYTNV
jgi:hypothetical protein